MSRLLAAGDDDGQGPRRTDRVSPGSTTLVVTVRSLKNLRIVFLSFVPPALLVTGTAESKITDWRGATEKEVGRK